MLLRVVLFKMKDAVKAKIAEEIAELHGLKEEKATAIVNKVFKLISQNGYTITRNK
jgi:nucleoid DNA-binding protein